MGRSFDPGMSNGASKGMCSIDTEATTFERGEEEGREDSAESELLARESGLLLRPPRLEDAGLEDCALPPESIQEAFFIAAKSLNSRLASYYSEDDEDEGGVEFGTVGTCVQVREAGFGDEAIIDLERSSRCGAMERGSWCPEEALGRCLVLEESGAEMPCFTQVKAPGDEGTRMVTRGEQTMQAAEGSAEAVIIVQGPGA